jgi:predicted TIM-barrel fold metal-dependent hydrolase
MQAHAGFYGRIAHDHRRSHPHLRPLRTGFRRELSAPGERIQWGTDWPYLGVPYPNLIRAIREAPFLNDAGVDEIMGLNAQRFLEI